jgi:biopolymer transport protein ExbD
VKIRRSPAPSPVLIFLAPGLQLSLILVVFLLLSMSFLLQPGVSVVLPKSPFILSPQRSPRIVTITAPPLSAIFYENQEVSETQLRERLQSIKGRTQTIIVKADRRAFYDKVSAVTNAALELGFPVVLATSEQGTGP